MRSAKPWVFCLALLCAACDSTGVGDEPGLNHRQSITLTPSDEAELNSGTVSVSLDSLSLLSRSKWHYDPDDPNVHSEPIIYAGLWLATDQGGPRSNIAANFGWNNGFEFVKTETDSVGIFVITRNSLDSEILNWPVALGAPVEFDGSPRMYGDIMAWAAYQPFAYGDETNSLQGIRVGLSVFMFDQAPLSSAIFLRYDIKNTSSETLSNLHAGYGGDTDVVQYGEHSVRLCNPLRWSDNQTGYDLSRHVTYTYISPHPEDDPHPDDCYGAVAGYSILDMSSPGGLGRHKLAHRIWTRWDQFSFPEFSDLRLENGQVILYALQGLSPSGDPMVDPTTGTPTQFAFTGNPIAKTGWIDERRDVRSLQSIQPFDLAPDEERTITVVWLMAYGDNLEHGLTLFREKFDQIISHRDAWDF